MENETQLIQQEMMQWLPEEWQSGMSREAFEQKLAAWLNELVASQPAQLVQLLYRLDIPEQQLQQALQQTTGNNAGTCIARFILLRQQEKICSRQQFKQQKDDIPWADRW